MHNYLITDDDSDLIIGYCRDISGLSNVSLENEYTSYNLILEGLELTEIYIKHSTAAKSKVSGININMLGQDRKILGSYFFGIEKPIHFYKSLVLEGNHNLSLKGRFFSAPSFEAMEIWEQWMISKPKKINAWAGLSKKQRLGWLEVVCNHSSFNNSNIAENSQYYLDMTYVVDIISFYCALGEAMNGPGGYYGSTLDGVEDCFCGGFGAVPPFCLHFRNGNLDELIHQDKFVEADQKKLQILKELFISNRVTLFY